jgi:hypothetical protein
MYKITTEGNGSQEVLKWQLLGGAETHTKA